MKTEHLLLIAASALSVLAGPARPDCGVTKTFVATTCGIEYGGTWVECATGMTAMPTFSVPQCTSTPSSASSASSTKTSSNVAVITPAPALQRLAIDANSTTSTSCLPVWVYVDAIASCGGVAQRYGTSYDACSGEPSLVKPTCTLEDVVATTLSGAVTTTAAAEEASAAVDAMCIEHPAWCRPW